MQVLSEKISREQLKELASNTFIDMIKCVADKATAAVMLRIQKSGNK